MRQYLVTFGEQDNKIMIKANSADEAINKAKRVVIELVKTGQANFDENFENTKSVIDAFAFGHFAQGMQKTGFGGVF